MKSFLQSALNSLKPAKTKYTLITGGHLKLTRDLLENITKNNTTNKKNPLLLNKFFILHKDYDIQRDEFYTKHEHMQVFNCDMNKTDEFEEFSSFLDKQKFKFHSVIHADHYISSLDHSQHCNYEELKTMICTNIENPMLLNSRLIGKNKIEIGSKILHFLMPTTSNLKNIPEFYPQRLFSQSMKHMVKCLKDDLVKNPVFFSLLKSQTFDEMYLERFECNQTINEEDIEEYRKNYNPTLDLLRILLSDKIEGYDFAKKFWDLNDLKVFVDLNSKL